MLSNIKNTQNKTKNNPPYLCNTSGKILTRINSYLLKMCFWCSVFTSLLSFINLIRKITISLFLHMSICFWSNRRTVIGFQTEEETISFDLLFVLVKIVGVGLAHYLQQHATEFKDISCIPMWSVIVLFHSMVLKIYVLVWKHNCFSRTFFLLLVTEMTPKLA